MTELPEGYDQMMFIRCMVCGIDKNVPNDCDTKDEVCQYCDVKGLWEVLPF